MTLWIFLSNLIVAHIAAAPDAPPPSPMRMPRMPNLARGRGGGVGCHSVREENGGGMGQSGTVTFRWKRQGRGRNCSRHCHLPSPSLPLL